jgi:hypothetical protein
MPVFSLLSSILLSFFSTLNLKEILKGGHWDGSSDFTKGLAHSTQKVETVNKFMY